MTYAVLASLVHSEPINNAMPYETVAKVISRDTIVLSFLVGTNLGKPFCNS